MRNRNKQINLRLTDAEYAKLQRLARRCGLSVSAYARMCLLDRPPVESPPIEYNQLTQALYAALNKLDVSDTEGHAEVLNALLAVQQAVTLPKGA